MIALVPTKSGPPECTEWNQHRMCVGKDCKVFRPAMKDPASAPPRQNPFHHPVLPLRGYKEQVPRVLQELHPKMRRKDMVRNAWTFGEVMFRKAPKMEKKLERGCVHCHHLECECSQLEDPAFNDHVTNPPFIAHRVAIDMRCMNGMDDDPDPMEQEEDEERRQETHDEKPMDVDGQKALTQDRRESRRTWLDASDEKYRQTWPGTPTIRPMDEENMEAMREEWRRTRD